MDYSAFDSLIDSVFIIDEDRSILYCNTAAAAFCGSSVRRLTKGTRIFDVLTVSDESLLVMPQGLSGKETATGFIELEYKLVASGNAGKVQINIQPFVEDARPRFAVVLHDVTLEETLHRKYRGELEQKEGYIIELRKAQAELEEYSKNLEKMVEVRTAEVRRANQMLSAIMNSLGQGFFVFDHQGTCGSIYTKACLDVVECQPAGMKIWEVFKIFGAERDEFSKWVETTFSEALPFDTMIDLAPKLFSHSQNRHVTLDYYPLRDESDKITSIVVVATDKTVEYEAGIALEREKLHAQMVMKIIRTRDHFSQFLASTRDLIVDVQKSSNVSDVEKLDVGSLFRKLHTLEGEAAAFCILSLRAASRVPQDLLEALKWGEKVDSKEFLPRLTSSISELAKTFNTYLQENETLFEALGLEKGRKIEIPYLKLLAFHGHLEKHGVPKGLIQDFEDDFMRVPLKNCLRPLEEAALVVAAKQSKILNAFKIETNGVQIILDGYEKLLATLVHAIRNSVDHGIEEPGERTAVGKSEAGQIIIRGQWKARNSGRWLKIEIQDDGRGIDPDKIREKLEQRYPGEDWKQKTDHEVLQYIFEAGLSSRDEIGEFSGRGIGMDAILNEARRLGGLASVESEVGKGTTLSIEVPDQTLSLAMKIGA